MNYNDLNSAPQENTGATQSLFLPLVLLGAALFLFLFFQTFLAIQERSQINNNIAQNADVVKQAENSKQALSTLINSLSELDQAGSQNARAIIQSLPRYGIQFQPRPAAPQ